MGVEQHNIANMSVFNLENIDDVLTEYLGGKYQISKSSESLLGGNSKQHVRKLNVTIKGTKKFGKNEIEMEALAKLLPGSENCPDAQYSKAAMKKEIDFYKRVLPKLQDFQRQYKVEVFSACPEYLGSRLNLKGGKEVDQDSVLLLQNLCESGFGQCDPCEGLDLETISLILSNLAEFHTIPIVMKQRKPMEFKKYVKDKCIELSTPNTIDLEKYSKEVLYETLYENNGCLPYIKKLKQGLKDHKPPFAIHAEETFATVIHNELWSKNIFVQYHKDKPNKVMFIDFKHYTYGSPASDVLNLLLSSANDSVLDQHFHEMLKFYHTHLVKNLAKYDVELDSFNYDNFIDQVKAAAMPVLFNAIFFLLEVIYEEKNLGRLSLEAKQRIWLLVQQIGSSGWLL